MSYHRLVAPHLVTRRLFPDFTFDTTREVFKFPVSQLKQYDAILLHSTASVMKDDGKMKLVDHDLVFDNAKAAGVPTILDIDDYWHAKPDMFFHPVWKMEQRQQSVEHSLKRADAVTCVSAPLARQIQKHTGRTPYILPNCIDRNDPQFWDQPTKSNRVRFGFLGGASHEHDIKIVGEAVKRLWSNYPDLRSKWQLVFAGFSMEYKVNDRKALPREIPSVKMEKSLTDGYRTVSGECAEQLQRYEKGRIDFTNENYRRVWAREVNQYATMYNYYDVAIAPLRNDTFNSCKSELKIVEAAAFNKHIICSDVAPFSNVMRELDLSGDDGLNICKDSDWLDTMLSYIDEFCATGSIAPPTYAAKVNERYNPEVWAEARYSIYKSVIG